MPFELDHNIYNDAAKTRLSEKLGAQTIAESQATQGVNDQKVKQAKIIQYLSMATPENWGQLRQQAISEGIGSEQTIPPQYDDAWNHKVLDTINTDGLNARVAAAGGATGALADRYMKDHPGSNFSDALYSVQTGFRQGTQSGPNGVTPIPGAPAAKGAFAGAVKSSEVKAENQTNAEINLPAVEAQGAYSKQLLDDLIAHPGMAGSVGLKDSSYLWGLKDNPIGGTNEASFMERLKQIQGKNFLEAYNSLKGGGSITEVEGAKATQAIARMGTAQKEEDFVAAAKELKDVIDLGINRARVKAAGGDPFAVYPEAAKESTGKTLDSIVPPAGGVPAANLPKERVWGAPK